MFRNVAGYIVIPVDVGDKSSPSTEVHPLKTESTVAPPPTKHAYSEVIKSDNLKKLNI